MRRPRFFLDANVLVDAQVRDFLLRTAEAGVIEIRWSQDVLAETERALLTLVPEAARRRRLVAALAEAFPDAMVSGFQHLVEDLVLPDPGDRHVLAAAVSADCDVIVTNNLRDFPDTLCSTYDLLALDVDDALLVVAGEAGQVVDDIVRSQVAALNRPATTVEAFIDRLSERAPQAATMIGAALGLPSQQRMLAELLRAHSEDSPQEAVRRILDALEANDHEAVSDLVDPPLRASLAPGQGDSPAAIATALVQALRDVLTSDGWGFATAWRPHSPDVELVKLVRGGEHARITDGPELVQGHLLYMRRAVSGWRLCELDGPDPGLAEPRPEGFPRS